MIDQLLSSLMCDLSYARSGDRPPPPSDRQGGGQAGAGIPSPPPPIHPHTVSAPQQPEIIFSEGKCSDHPDAPHGFDRNASHSAHRYVCECEGWSPEPDPVLCPKCEDWTVPDEDGDCPMCGTQPTHREHDDGDMER